MFFKLICRITSTGQDGEPVTDEDEPDSDTSMSDKVDGQSGNQQSEDEITRNSDLQVTLFSNI